jgi:medium-chain acyl-[acyl-carrier-protein] hydrolase
MYRKWLDAFPDQVEVLGVQLPGREAQMRQPLVSDFRSLCGLVEAALEPYFDSPFAFFGHSMGSWLAFELTRSLRRQGKPLPVHLFVSGRRSPQLPERHALMHSLEDKRLIAEIQQRYRGIPAEVLAEPDLMDLVLPILRADLEALEQHEYSSEQPLSCPISCFGGMEDSQVDRYELEAWKEQTDASFKLEMLPGGHSFAQDPPLERSLLRSLRGQIAEYLDPHRL